MPTKSVTPDTKNYKSWIPLVSRWKLAPFVGGWVFRDFLGDFLNLHDLVGLLILVCPPCWAWVIALAPTIAALVRSGFSWV